ncbi:MAG TPA: hypothetical protein VIW92_04410 [Thermoanaerobaculia bacterium]
MRNSHRKGTFRLAALGLAAATVLGLAAPALAGEEREAGIKKPVDSLIAAIDAKGKLRQPTPAEAKQLVDGLKSMSKSTEGLPVTHWPDGTMSLDLSGAFLHVWVAYVGQDGALHEACVDSPEAAASLFNPAPVAEDK